MTNAGRLFLRSLTEKERRVVAMVSAGLPYKVIAVRMNSSCQVVKNCMREILGKAGRHRRCELMLFVFRHGVVECPCKRREQMSKMLTFEADPAIDAQPAACSPGELPGPPPG